MKKKISLPVMAVAAILLLGGCGTQMYDLSETKKIWSCSIRRIFLQSIILSRKTE